MTIRARLVCYLPGTDQRAGHLPEPLSWQASLPRNAVGALSLTYSSKAVGGGLLMQALDAGLDVALEVDWGSGWIEPDGARYCLIGRQADVTDATGALTLTLPSYGWLLSKIRNLALDLLEAGGDFEGQRLYVDVSAGAIMRSQLDEYAARHATQPALDWGFTAAGDSAGTAWSDTRTLPYDVGVDAGSILAGLASMGMCDWVTVGRVLALYVRDSQATDLSGRVRLRAGLDISTAPSTETLEDSAGYFLVRGEAGVVATVMEPSAPSAWGVWEGFLSASGATSEADARTAVAHDIERRARAAGEYTRTLTLAGDLLPLRDYRPGDIISAPAVTGDAPMRVEQIVLSRDGQGAISGSLVLNDRMVPAELRTRKRASALMSGAALAGSGVAIPNPVRLSQFTRSAINAVVQEAVDATMPSISGKNTIVHALIAPGAGDRNGYVAGDVWYRYAPGSPPSVIGWWRFTDGDWVQQVLDETFLPLVNIGSGTYGTLSGVRLEAGSATVDKLTAAAFSMNLVPNGDFEDGLLCWQQIEGSPGMVDLSAWAASGRQSMSLLKPTGAGTNTGAFSGVIPVAGGERISLRSRVASSAVSVVVMRVWWLNADRADIGTADWWVGNVNGSYPEVRGVLVAPAAAAYFRVGAYNTTASTQVVVDRIQAQRPIDGDLIVDGAIDGRTITGATVRTAATGRRLEMTGSEIRGWVGTDEPLDLIINPDEIVVGGDVSGLRLDSRGLINIDSGSGLRLGDSVTVGSTVGSLYLSAGAGGRVLVSPPLTPYTGSANAALVSDSGWHRLTPASSLRRHKVLIDDLPVRTSDLLGLRARWWFDVGEVREVGLDPDTATEAECEAAGLRRIPGFVAEEVAEAAPVFATYERTADGSVLTGVAYDRMAAGLLIVAQRNAETISKLSGQIGSLTARLNQVTARLDALEAQDA